MAYGSASGNPAMYCLYVSNYTSNLDVISIKTLRRCCDSGHKGLALLFLRAWLIFLALAYKELTILVERNEEKFDFFTLLWEEIVDFSSDLFEIIDLSLSGWEVSDILYNK